MKTTYQYDHYFKYDEIKTILETFNEKYPELMELEVNCVTNEKRNQYAVTLTNKKTGNALDKPGWYMDGNIHAGEVTASMCCMYTIDALLTNYGKDEEITELLDTTTLYIIPRVTPDGAEVFLTTPYSLRSVNKEYGKKGNGIKSEDIDHDGVIRMMKVFSPYGAFKMENDEIVLREPSDTKGEFFDIVPEGALEEDFTNLSVQKSKWGLDFNRNFPFGWFPESRQPGAGDYPLSNPECKALCDFVLKHPNIGGAAIGHTSGGVILYPPGTKAASKAPEFDIKVLKEIAKMGQKTLGYKPMNIFDSFVDDQEFFDSGAFDDWCYQTQGIPSYTMEFWDIQTKAGITRDWDSKEEDIEKELNNFKKTLKWIKENAPEYYMEFETFDHPVLGQVEIGGFNSKFTFQNPPEKFLSQELENDFKFNVKFAKSMPRLIIDTIEVAKIAKDIHKISVTVGNIGYLPTNLTKEAINLKVNDPVHIECNATLLMGESVYDCGDLEGFSASSLQIYGNINTKCASSKVKVEWMIQAKENDVITIKVSNKKAGTISKEIIL